MPMLNLNDGFGVPNPINALTVAERPETALSSGRRANWQKTRFDPILALASIHDMCKYCPHTFRSQSPSGSAQLVKRGTFAPDLHELTGCSCIAVAGPLTMRFVTAAAKNRPDD